MRLTPGDTRSILALAVCGVLAAAFAAAQESPRVDDAALANAGQTGADWITYNTNWAEQRYSPLSQINASNIGRLGLAWSLDIPASGGSQAGTRQEATPLVHNGMVYSIAPWSVVYAVDARTGKEVWHQDPDVNQEVWRSRICCGVVNRGIALYEGKIIAPVIDGRLRALDAATGKIVWETRVAPENMPYTITMAPRVIKGGRIIIGVAGGEYAIRGFFSAFDANTGKQLWRFYTVPGDPSKPFEQPELERAAKTWSNEWWKIGGGAAVWNGLAYDPDADIVYVGTGQPGPWTDHARGPGDNLFANCILAVRGATGKLVWFYQEVPGDNWDYDSIADLMLADLTIDGHLRHVIMHAPKDAFFYVLDRLTGEVISADPITKISWATGIDLKTGKPQVNPAARYSTTPIRVMPGPSGGHVWPPWSYNPQTGLVYIPGTAGGSYVYQADPDFVPASTDVGPTGRGQFNMGTGTGRAGRAGRGARAAAQPAATEAGGNVHAETPAPTQAPAPATIPTIGPAIGPDGVSGNVLYAWDPVARRERWRAPNAGAGPFSGGSLTTAGNIVFSSVNNHLLAFRADTGEKILDLATDLTQMGPPITYLIDGRQYITVSGGPPAAPGGRSAGLGQTATVVGQPSHMLTFMLDGHASLPSAPKP